MRGSSAESPASSQRSVDPRRLTPPSLLPLGGVGAVWHSAATCQCDGLQCIDRLVIVESGCLGAILGRITLRRCKARAGRQPLPTRLCMTGTFQSCPVSTPAPRFATPRMPRGVRDTDGAKGSGHVTGQQIAEVRSAGDGGCSGGQIRCLPSRCLRPMGPECDGQVAAQGRSQT